MEVVSKGHQGDLPECRSYMGETAEDRKKLRVREMKGRHTEIDQKKEKSSLIFQIK